MAEHQIIKRAMNIGFVKGLSHSVYMTEATIEVGMPINVIVV